MSTNGRQHFRNTFTQQLGWTELGTECEDSADVPVTPGPPTPHILRHATVDGDHHNSLFTKQLIQRFWEEEESWTPQVSKTWTTIESVVIILNCIEMGAECQWTVQNYKSLRSVYLGMDIFFLGLYTTSIALRLRNLGARGYFCGLQAKWNVLDVVLTVFGLFPCLHKMHILDAEQSVKIGEISSMVRTVRIVRIVKVLRHVKNLTVVVEGLARSMTSMFWVIVMLALLVYTFGIFFTLTVDSTNYDSGDCFASLLVSMATLSDVVMGNSWGVIITPLVQNQPTLVPFLFLFTIIAQVGLLNLIVGIICDATAATRRKIEWRQSLQDLKDLSDFWTQVLPVHNLELGDSDDDNAELSPERKEKIMLILQSVIDSRIVDFPPATTAFEVYDMLDVDANGGLSHKEFVIGIGRILLGDSFQLALVDLAMQGQSRRAHRQADREHSEALDQIGKRLTGIEQAVATLLANLQHGSTNQPVSGSELQSSLQQVHGKSIHSGQPGCDQQPSVRQRAGTSRFVL